MSTKIYFVWFNHFWWKIVAKNKLPSTLTCNCTFDISNMSNTFNTMAFYSHIWTTCPCELPHTEMGLKIFVIVVPKEGYWVVHDEQPVLSRFQEICIGPLKKKCPKIYLSKHFYSTLGVIPRWQWQWQRS